MNRLAAQDRIALGRAFRARCLAVKDGRDKGVEIVSPRKLLIPKQSAGFGPVTDVCRKARIGGRI